MNTVEQNLVLVGVKHTVVAFDRETGARVWSQDLGTGYNGKGYVTLLADGQRVFAHTYGEVYCLNLRDGSLLWRDKLPGLGYGLASIAIPDGPAVSPAVMEMAGQEQAAAAVVIASAVAMNH